MDDMEHKIGSYGDNVEMEHDMEHEIGSLEIEIDGDDLNAEGLNVDNTKIFVYYPQVADEFTPKNWSIK